MAETERQTAASEVCNAEDEYEKFCTTTAQSIKDMLRASNTNHRYNNYNKAMFKTDVQALLDDGNTDEAILSDEQADMARAECRAIPKAAVNELATPPIDPIGLDTEIRIALRQTVARVAIASLADFPDLEAWVAEGRRMHEAAETTKCLYCSSQISEDRATALEAHFNDAYENAVADLDRLCQTARAESQMLQSLSPHDASRIYEHMEADYKTAVARFVDAQGKLTEWYSEAIAQLEAKKTTLSKEVECSLADPPEITSAVDGVNEVLRRHNNYGSTLNDSIANARERLAKSALARSSAEYKRLSESVTATKAHRDTSEQEAERLSTEIHRLEAEMIQHRAPAAELNVGLRRYLGHGELALEPTETGYRITRNGKVAFSLSEGEQTALALLYWLQSLKSQDFDLRNGIVVLDDPVSSLDQSAMFAAFGAIRDQVRQAKQVVILTHNFTFFRLVREWFKNLRGQEKQDKAFFMLRSVAAEDGRASMLTQLDPLLLDFESEYHYLFSQVYNLAMSPAQSRLEVYFNAPNMARRMLEMFLAFSVPDVGDRSLWNRMLNAVGSDEAALKEAVLPRIYRYVQAHSHSDAIGDADEDMTLLAESRSVLNDVLQFMRCVNADHCSRMIRRCAPESYNENEPQ